MRLGAVGADTVGVTTAANGVVVVVCPGDAVAGTAAVATIDGAGEWLIVAAVGCGWMGFFVALMDMSAVVEVDAVVVTLAA
ncbi:hypothetical protein [Mycolicibacterium aubagnense]|nr:hypothetical protein [Mycolicibacterium aubagnense]WGI34748.1 hypothetical protein QDT91_10585 [Mycolicibacterium aubagnense]